MRRFTVESRADRLFVRDGWMKGYPPDVTVADLRGLMAWKMVALNVALHDLWREAGLFRLIRWMARSLPR